MEKQVKELNFRVVDLEAAISVDPSKGSRRLESKIQDLNEQLSKANREKDEATFSCKKFERNIRDFTQQLTDKERIRVRQEDDLNKVNDKLKKMKEHVDELESNESTLQMSRRRAEREADEFKDKSYRLEKEVEKLKLRVDRMAPQTAQ